MRAREFITESDVKGRGPISKRQQTSTRGLNVFSDSERWNSDYTLNRVMMAVACSDGETMPDIHRDSWAGKYKTAHPYSKEEQEMLKLAYQAVGANWQDINHGDLDSDELDGTNTKSPVLGFNGYKNKKKKK
jgi:hypothetical protein